MARMMVVWEERGVEGRVLREVDIANDVYANEFADSYASIEKKMRGGRIRQGFVASARSISGSGRFGLDDAGSR
jgi:hypothetical protein